MIYIKVVNISYIIMNLLLLLNDYWVYILYISKK